MLKLNAVQLRKHKTTLLNSWKKKGIKRQEIYIVLDDILDTYNIGSIFRLADAVGAKKIYLCRGSETPPNHRIKKASVNTSEWVDWEYKENTVDAIKDLRKKVPTINIVAIELAAGSLPYDQYDYALPIAFVVGHETDGISPEVLEIVDQTVEIPMFGVNVSLNVMVSLAIVLYQAIKDTGSAWYQAIEVNSAK